MEVEDAHCVSIFMELHAWIHRDLEGQGCDNAQINHNARFIAHPVPSNRIRQSNLLKQTGEEEVKRGLSCSEGKEVRKLFLYLLAITEATLAFSEQALGTSQSLPAQQIGSV
jgi:hypothetical protein